MSIGSSSSSRSLSSSLPTRISHMQIESRTSSPSTPSRRRNNAHLASSIFPSTSSIPVKRQSAVLPSIAQRKDEDDPSEVDASHTDHHQTVIEWNIYGLARLRQHLEEGDERSSTDDGQEDGGIPDVLKDGAIGEGYKLDLAKHRPKHSVSETSAESASTSSDPTFSQALSLFIVPLYLDSQPFDYTHTTSIFAGIKLIDIPAGSRFAETKWVWTTQVDEFEFSKDTEFWETKLPLALELLEDEELRSADGFSICVRIGSPPNSDPAFNLPGQVMVPTSIIGGLNSLLDAPTGDVRFMCMELTTPQETIKDDATSTPSTTLPLARKRVVSAHSEILKARSEYFHDLLTGGFSESDSTRRTDRQTTIIVDDACFQTVYWLLRFLYTNELSFAPDEDVRLQMDQLRLDKKEVGKMLAGAGGYIGGGEWEYRRLPMEGDSPDNGSEDDLDLKTVRSISSAGTSVSRRVSAISPGSSTTSSVRDKPKTPTHSTTTTTTTPKARSNSTASVPSTTSKTSSTSITTNLTRTTASSSTPRNRLTTQKPITTGAISTQTSPKSKPLGSRSSYSLPRLHASPDPHSHPTPTAHPASALAIYMLAHRYRLDVLEGLAKEHILARMTGGNCMPMLLATHRYDTLHTAVLDYVVDNWSVVQSSGEFLRCITEVSGGVWGEEGGLVLHGLFQRF